MEVNRPSRGLEWARRQPAVTRSRPAGPRSRVRLSPEGVQVITAGRQSLPDCGGRLAEAEQKMQLEAVNTGRALWRPRA
jgi:hypothetical protein